jgi:hypothetical protein
MGCNDFERGYRMPFENENDSFYLDVWTIVRYEIPSLNGNFFFTSA